MQIQYFYCYNMSNELLSIYRNMKTDMNVIQIYLEIEPLTRLRVRGGIVLYIYPLGPLHLSGPSGMFSTFPFSLHTLIVC